MSTRNRIPELATIEFTGARSITDYSKTGRGLCRELSWEFEMSAGELYAVLVAQQKGHPLLFGVDVKWKAKRIVARLLRAGDHTAMAGVELVKFHQQFRKEFADVLKPPKNKRVFDFEDE